MNIHFTDRALFEKLCKASIAKVLIGSHMYGTNHSQSDLDYLYIYATSDNELNSFIRTHHQLQFKEDGVDHNFVSLHTFLENTLNGDSTINFEVIHSGALVGTCLEFLYTNREMFNTYTVVRSYLGMARRDAKFYHKENTVADKAKKLGHIIRAKIYCVRLLSHNFDFHGANETLKEFISDLVNECDNNIRLRKEEGMISYLRTALNEKFEQKTLNMPQRMDVNDAKVLTLAIQGLMRNETYLSCKAVLEDFDISMFLNAYENWVEY